jgi:endonuclease/exonuclease/phosphatase family metal-dependent hydrolase
MQLITWNIQSCRGCDGAVSPRRIVEHARALGDFDVLCVQEVAANFPAVQGGACEDQYAALVELLPGFAVATGIAVDTLGADDKRSRYGNAIFSRLPILQVISSRLPRPSDPVARRGMHRNLLEVVLDTGSGPLRIMTTHLEFHSARQRAAQVEAILQRHAEACLRDGDGQAIDRSGGPFHTWPEPADAILTGDFNFPVDDPLHRRMQTGVAENVPPFTDSWIYMYPDEQRPATVGVHDIVQWPEPFACDFIFATPRLLPKIRRMEIDQRSAASDHQPVLIELAAGN